MWGDDRCCVCGTETNDLEACEATHIEQAEEDVRYAEDDLREMTRIIREARRRREGAS